LCQESPALDKRSPSFTKSLSSSINSYATAEDSSPHVSGFLARHRSQDRAPSIPRSVSFGTARELRSTALASFKERSYSISGPTVPSRSASLGNIQEVEILRSVRSQPVSISSTEELHDLLSLNTEPLFIDVERRRNHDFVFPRSTLITIPPVATPRRRSSAKSRSFSIPRQASPSPSLGVPLIYRSASAATLHDPHRRKEPVFVPARIHHQQRSTDETMATQGSTNPFDNASPVWQGDCPVRAASAMAQPPRVPAHGVAALVAATALAQPPAAVVRAPAPRRRGFFRRLRDRLRRLVGKD